MPILSWYDDQSDRELFKLTPLLRNLARVPDVRSVLGKVHENHVMDLEKAERLTKAILREIESPPSRGNASKRPLSMNTDDFDLNDRISGDTDILKIGEQPFGPKRRSN